MEQENNNLGSNTPKNEGTAPRPSIDDFITQPRQHQPTLQANKDDANQHHTSQTGDTFPASPSPKPTKTGKATKMWLIVFAILFIAAAAAAGFYYMKYSNVNTEIDSYKQENTTQTAQIAELQKSSETAASLQKTVDSQKTFIDNLTAVANELKTTFDSKCDSITVPTYTQDNE